MRVDAYSTAVSRQSRAAPIAPKMMPKRASLRQLSGPRSPRASGSMAEPGSRTSWSTSSEVTDARSDILAVISGAEKPGVPVGTTKPRMPRAPSSRSVLAHTTATSATEPLVIHILAPLSTQSSPSRRAVVRMPPGSEPKSGSVRPKQPSARPAAMRGSHSCFCSSLPQWWIANIASEPCTDTSERIPESTASSSRHARPYDTEFIPAQPYPSRCIPSTPSEPSSSASSRAGMRASSNHCAMCGRMRLAAKPRTASRMAISSSLSRVSSAKSSVTVRVSAMGCSWIVRARPARCGGAWSRLPVQTIAQTFAFVM